MEWVKIKAQHVLNTGLSAENIGRLVQFQALAALKERIPTDAEIAKIMRPKAYQKLLKSLEEVGENLTSIALKVLLDVKDYLDEKDFQKKKKRLQREKSRLEAGFVPRDVPKLLCRDVPGPIREDKRREDKSVVVQHGDNNTFYRTIFRIFRIRKKRNPLADAGLLRHLSKIDSSEERALWAVEIAEYKKTVLEERKKQIAERKKRDLDKSKKSEVERNDSFVRGVMIRFESLAEDQKNYVLQTAVAMYTVKNGEIQMPGKPSPRFIVGAMPHEVDSVLRDEIHV